MPAGTRVKKESVVISVLGSGMAGNVEFVNQPKMLCPAAGPAKLEPVQKSLMLSGIMASSSKSSTSASLWQTGLKTDRKGDSGQQVSRFWRERSGSELTDHRVMIDPLKS